MKRKPNTDERVIYSERVSLVLWVQLLIVCLFILFTALMILFLLKNLLIVLIVYGATILLIAPMAANFWTLEFWVTEQEVRFGFGRFQKTFPRSRIISCEPYQLRFRNYLGYGIRFGWDGTIAYNTRNGKGVKLVIEGQKRPYVLSLDNPERVCEILVSREV